MALSSMLHVCICNIQGIVTAWLYHVYKKKETKVTVSVLKKRSKYTKGWKNKTKKREGERAFLTIIFDRATQNNVQIFYTDAFNSANDHDSNNENSQMVERKKIGLFGLEVTLLWWSGSGVWSGHTPHTSSLNHHHKILQSKSFFFLTFSSLCHCTITTCLLKAFVLKICTLF